MKLDDYVTLGRSGLRVSPMCLGTMTFGQGHGWGIELEESHALLDHYFAAGGNFIDTANFYGASRSEDIVGAWLVKEAGRRRRSVVATKFGGNLFPGDPNGGGAGRKSMIAACEDSLRRLQTDYIDLYWLHWDDPHTPIEETMRALDDLVRAGKVLHVGFSDMPAWKVAQAQCLAQFKGFAPVIALQLQYSLLERTIEGSFVPLAAEMGMAIMPWSPLKFGTLSGKFRRGQSGDSGRLSMTGDVLPDHDYDVIEAVIAIAERMQVSPAQVALAWVLAKPGVTAPITGVRRIDQLTDNLGALGVTLSAEDMAALDAISAPVLGFPDNVLPLNQRLSFGGLSINGKSYEAFTG